MVSGLRYIRAANAAGTAWEQPITVDDVMDPGISNKLLEYEGNPAVIYSNGATQFHISLGSDPVGSSWHRELVYASASLSQFDAILLPGGIGVAVDDADTGVLVYKFAEIGGFNIQVGADVNMFSPNTGKNFYINLGVSGESPYAISLRSGSSKLQYSFAHDGTGQTWTAPALINVQGKVQSRAGTAALGLPWVCYQDGDTGILHSGHAVEPASNVWINEADVNDQPQTVGWIKMARAGVHPSVAWIDDAAKLLYFAAYY
jgi:hypothetical protein